MAAGPAKPKSNSITAPSPDDVRRYYENLGYDVDMSGVKSGTMPDMNPRDLDAMDAIRANYETAMNANKDANKFRVLNAQTPTNWFTGTGLVQGAEGMGGWNGAANFGEMNDINTRLAAANKPAAIKQMTQRELAWLKGTAPSAGSTYDQNAKLVENYNNRYAYTKAKLAFYNAWAKSHNNSLNGAPDAWNDFDDQHFDSSGKYISTAQIQNQRQRRQAAASQVATDDGSAAPPSAPPPGVPSQKPNRAQLNGAVKAISAANRGQAAPGASGWATPTAPMAPGQSAPWMAPTADPVNPNDWSSLGQVPGS
jgi:hypothetical protein